MFKFDEYTVKFKHVYDPASDVVRTMGVTKSSVKRAIKSGAMLPYKAKTICTIFKDGQVIPVASGVVMLSWFDVFDQQYAVEKSFARAITQLYPLPSPSGYSKENTKMQRWMAWIEFAKHHKSHMGHLSEVAKGLQP